MKGNMKKTKRILVLLILSAVIPIIGIPLGFSYAKSTVSDIDGHWANKKITAWIEQGLIKGYPDGTFKPNNSITRAEFAALVNRALKLDEKTTISYVDIKENDWFYAEIAKAKKAGYLDGYKGGTIKPKAFITRQEVATIVSRLKTLKEDTAQTSSFTDAIKIPDWSKGAIGAVVKASFMKGYPNGNFEPRKNISRAESIEVLNNLVGIKISEICQQTIVVNASVNVPVKVDPSDAQLSVQSSDQTVVTATVSSTNIQLKGLKIGNSIITATAKKDGLIDGIITFNVVVQQVISSSGGGGGGGSSPTSNNKPVITVVEPDGVNDQVITLAIGANFVAPTVTASDAEDGNITSKIVKVGEDKVNTSKAGEYVLTYNVSDSKGLAADEKKVTVKVVGGTINATANIIVDVAEDLPAFKNITVKSATVGSKFKVEGSTSVKPFGEAITIKTSAATVTVYILDSSGNVLGTFTVDVSSDSTKDITFQALIIEEGDATANVVVDVAEDLPAFKNITVKSSTVGSKFKVEGSTSVKPFGEAITIKTSALTATVYVLDSGNNVLGIFTVDVSSDSTKDVKFKTQAKSKANIIVDVAEDLPAFKNITVKSSTVGSKFKVEGSTLVKAFGEEITIKTSAATALVSILDVSDNVVGTATVDVGSGSTKDYDLQN